MNLKKFSLLLVFFLAALFVVLAVSLPAHQALAQGNPSSGAIYIVQPGDTLWDIAQRFGISMQDLEKANGIADPGQLKAGDQLIIPGLEDIQGILTTRTIGFGETLLSLSRRYQVSPAILSRLNHLSSPVELYAGASLVIPENSQVETGIKRAVLAPGQSLLELAVLQNTDPWNIAATNLLSGTWDSLPGDILFISGKGEDGPGGLPSQIASVDINPLPLVQGRTTVIRISAQTGISLTGSLAGHTLHFFPDEEGKYIALQGIYAMASPGLYPFTLQGSITGGAPFGFSQMIRVVDGQYPVKAEPIPVDEAGLDPTITKPEDAEWMALAQTATQQKMWVQPVRFPSPPLFYDQYSSIFGVRRRYNDDPQLYFHTGLDIPGPVGTEVYAIAPGRVVFAGHLEVRGNAIMIDHGWGVYSSYMHLSEIKVQPGDLVEAGQVIGLVGNTGLRTTGAHLHWEMLVGDVQVDPLDWLQQSYP